MRVLAIGIETETAKRNRLQGGPVAMWFAAYAVIAVTAVLYLPYTVPLSPSASSSYLFGYNNRAGVALLLVLVAIGAIWTRGLGLDFSPPANSTPVQRKVFLYSLITVLLGCAAMYLLAGKLGGFGESTYEIDRIWLTSIGKRPYVDFEWPFGFILLYVPLAIRRLLPVSIPQAYYFFWGLNCLAGVCLLYDVLNKIDLPSERKTSVYLLLFCAWFLAIMNMGTHYTLTRYVLPLDFVLVIERRIKWGGARSYAIADLEILLFTTILLLYSPETAIAFAVASLGLFPMLALKRDMAFGLTYAPLPPALAALFVIASQVHILDTVVASGGGADSFPILLSPDILLFFAALFICACLAYRQIADPAVRGSSLGLIAYSILVLPAALGRCDPGHVYLNGIAVFAVFLLCASNRTQRWKPARTVFVLIVVVIPLFAGLWGYGPLLGRAGVRAAAGNGRDSFVNRMLLRSGKFYIQHFAPSSRKAEWEEHLESHLGGAASVIADLSILYPGWHGGYLAPLGYQPNGFGTDLSTQVDYGKYEGLENANTLAAVAEKIAEMRTHPGEALLLPENYLGYCALDVSAQRRALEIMFAFPYWKAPAHTENVHKPVCDYIQQHYLLVVPPTEDTWYYGLWTDTSSGQIATATSSSK